MSDRTGVDPSAIEALRKRFLQPNLKRDGLEQLASEIAFLITRREVKADQLHALTMASIQAGSCAYNQNVSGFAKALYSVLAAATAAVRDEEERTTLRAAVAEHGKPVTTVLHWLDVAPTDRAGLIKLKIPDVDKSLDVLVDLGLVEPAPAPEHSQLRQLTALGYRIAKSFFG